MEDRKLVTKMLHDFTAAQKELLVQAEERLQVKFELLYIPTETNCLYLKNYRSTRKNCLKCTKFGKSCAPMFKVYRICRSCLTFRLSPYRRRVTCSAYADFSFVSDTVLNFYLMLQDYWEIVVSALNPDCSYVFRFDLRRNCFLFTRKSCHSFFFLNHDCCLL